jgi:predicted nucleic acid-binding protein
VKGGLTLDSSVFIAALRPTESLHDQSRQLIERVVKGQYEVFVPYSVLVEVVAAAFRRTGSRPFARTVHAQFLQMPSIHFLDLVKSRASQACELAMASGLRGMDVLVLQVVREMGTTLVTLDEEFVELAKRVVRTQSVSALVAST